MPTIQIGPSDGCLELLASGAVLLCSAKTLMLVLRDVTCDDLRWGER